LQLAEKQGKQAGLATAVGAGEGDFLAGQQRGVRLLEQQAVAAAQAEVA
jgi:hypothetical protein